MGMRAVRAFDLHAVGHSRDTSSQLSTAVRLYAENETNYCARCQTGGRILADRALSRLLKKSWPRSIDDLP